MDWNEKILDAIDKDALEALCNPLEHFELDEKKTIYFVVVIF